MMLRLPALSSDPNGVFPNPENALAEPNGLLAMGGDLSPTRLLNAYRQGIFPWYSQGQPILWWCPDPRAVFVTAELQLASRFRRQLRTSTWQLRFDSAFAAVLNACVNTPRVGQSGTWITPAMQAAYSELHRLGHAHSVEVFDGDVLVGGLYGVAIGQMFFGESMFSAQSGASKVALAALNQRLAQWGWPLIDAQVENPHLMSLGAQRWPRAQFLRQIHTLCERPGQPGLWSQSIPEFAASELAKA